MELKKNQHYVSSGYLRSWEDSKGKLSVLDITNGKEFTPSAEGICLERYYYEDPKLPPTNEMENKFNEYEDAFGITRKFLTFVENNAIEDGQPVAETLASALSSLPNHPKTLKEFAGALYFRTPSALSAMREQLEKDESSKATQALNEINSPYALSMMAFDSTLLERFRNLHISLLHSKRRLNTSDCPCIPIAGGKMHANFGYDIGRHEAAMAIMPITPTVIALFMPNLDGRDPIVIAGDMTDSFAKKTNEIINESAKRFIIKG